MKKDKGGVGDFVRRTRIGTRLMVAFGALILLLAAMAAVGIWRLAELAERAEDLTAMNLRMERLVGEWAEQTRTNTLRRVVMTHSDDVDLVRMLAPDVERTTARINEVQAQVDQLVGEGEARGLFKAIEEKRATFLALRKPVEELKAEGNRAAAREMLTTRMIPAQAAYMDAMQALRDYYRADSQRDAQAAAESARSGREVLLAFCALGVLLALVFAWVITASVTRPVADAVRVARRVADGDLTQDAQPHGRDEITELLRALDDMTRGLRALATDVAQGARSVADSSAQIAQGNVDLSQRTEEQASTLEETASSMEELTSIVGQNAENARVAKELAAGAATIAREGGQSVGEVVATMDGISASSKRIAEIIGVIDGIAFQTNILALNAAVEAARAGEQGRGFAVVASEVRNLAQRSGQAAREIRTLIADSVSQVEAGSAQVDRAGRKMQDIVGAVARVSELIAEIATASEEQSSGIEQINAAVTQMEQVVQQNASLVEEAAAATQSMKSDADTLLQTVRRFRVGDHAAAAPVLQPVAPIAYRKAQAATQAAPRRAPPSSPAGEWKQF